MAFDKSDALLHPVVAKNMDPYTAYRTAWSGRLRNALAAGAVGDVAAPVVRFRHAGEHEQLLRLTLTQQRGAVVSRSADLRRSFGEASVTAE
ncbi:hypothetical protein CH92_09940 [Stutzerimonas stutzeri]|uniref:Uncharacterized protein n=1 Tax=Stutzerimonas stutzeri TaxID=316 RepID=W8RZR0_STUST|nr:hypothetical protein CH92_09940 [Stutzerimonas stutzeri]